MLDCAMALRARLHASHEPITRWPGGVARSLQCRTVSNATEASVEGARTEAPRRRKVWGQPAFGRVNASYTVPVKQKRFYPHA